MHVYWFVVSRRAVKGFRKPPDTTTEDGKTALCFFSSVMWKLGIPVLVHVESTFPENSEIQNRSVCAAVSIVICISLPLAIRIAVDREVVTVCLTSLIVIDILDCFLEKKTNTVSSMDNKQ
jgi:hypothetical protein